MGTVWLSPGLRRPLAAPAPARALPVARPKDDDNLRQSVDRALAARRADDCGYRISRPYFPFRLD